jgi:hypothetical protein
LMGLLMNGLMGLLMNGLMGLLMNGLMGLLMNVCVCVFSCSILDITDIISVKDVLIKPHLLSCVVMYSNSNMMDTLTGGSLLSYLKRNRTTILLNGDVIDEVM